jgi:hypothetical protein
MAGTAKHPLGTFDRREVIKSTIAVTNAGDGLSKAMGVEPQAMDLGDKVYVVLECEVAKVTFTEVDDTSKLARNHTLKAGDATIVDEDLVREHLDEQSRRIEEASGVHRLPLEEEGGEPKADEPKAGDQAG